MNKLLVLGVGLALTGCGQFALDQGASPPLSDNQTRPHARPDTTAVAPPPPETARTVEEFDTTTAASVSQLTKIALIRENGRNCKLPVFFRLKVKL